MSLPPYPHIQQHLPPLTPQSQLQPYQPPPPPLLPDKREHDESSSHPGTGFLTADPTPDEQVAGEPPSKKRAHSKLGLSQSSRTGQACDRCKNRKIKCDPNPDGCMPCRQNNTECKTTDRISGKASVRGHAENVERDNDVLREHIAQLEQQIRDLGIEPKRCLSLAPSSKTPSQSGEGTPGGRRGKSFGSQDLGRARPHSNHAIAARTTQTTRGSADTYLGVSPYSGGLSPVKGMSMSLFGVKFDIGDFITETTDARVKLMSGKSSLSSIFDIARSGEKPIAELPQTFQECRSYAEWYCIAFNSYYPILYKPELMELVSKIYNDNYNPNIPETVIIHMVLACMKLQLAIKNEDQGRGDPHLMQALAHYHNALTYWKELFSSRSPQDLQALALVCVFVRFFPSPDNTWSVTNTVFSVLIDRGYHRRAPKPWDDKSSKTDILKQELRKRIFYTVLCLLVNLNNRLNRPMPIKLSDFDVELPEFLNDDMERAEPGHEDHQCQCYIGITFSQHALILLDICSTMFALQPTMDYDEGIRTFAEKMEDWSKSVPDIVSEQVLTDNQAVKNHTNSLQLINAWWLQYARYDFNIKMHHPALCRSQDPEVICRNLDVCVASSRKLLEILMRLWDLQSVDATWFIITDAAAAIFTLVYAHWERRDSTSVDDLKELKRYFEPIVKVVGLIAKMFGAGPGLQETLQKFIDNGIGHIQKYHAERAALAAAEAASAALRDSGRRSSQNTRTTGPEVKPAPDHLAGEETYMDNSLTGNHAQQPLMLAHDVNADQNRIPYGVQQYQTPMSQMSQYPYTSYQAPIPDQGYAMLQPHHQAQAYAECPTMHAAQYHTQHYMAPVAWRHWAETARDFDLNVAIQSQQDYMSNANAMMALGAGGQQDSVHPGDHSQNRAGPPQAAYGIHLNNPMAANAGPFANMIPDATMHAALAMQEWNMQQQGHQGHQGHPGHTQRHSLGPGHPGASQ